jgi:hypothetical protein|tara:strand:- start:29 stop:331 length:303 start_codon:yes stop_codon:yes gene_type:complete
MIKLKNLLKEWNDTSFKSLPKRWSKPIDSFKDEKFDGLTELERKEAYGFNSGAKSNIVNPINQKYDFKKPTMVNLSKKELEILYTTGRIEADGITIIYED